MEPVTTDSLMGLAQQLGERPDSPLRLYLLGGSAMLLLGSPRAFAVLARRMDEKPGALRSPVCPIDQPAAWLGSGSGAKLEWVVASNDTGNFQKAEVTIMIVEIAFEDDVLAALRMSPSELANDVRLAAAIRWYAQARLSQGRAAEVAGVSRAEFIDALSDSGVSVSQVTVAELEEELHGG